VKFKKEGFSAPLSAKKKDINTDENFFVSLDFDFFWVLLKFAFRIRPKVVLYYHC